MRYKYRLKDFLRKIDYKFGIRAWFSSEPNQVLEDNSFLRGEKELDYGWVAANVGHGPGLALDVGCVNSPLSSILASLKYQVVGIDLRDDIPYELKKFSLIQGDFNKVEFVPASFDLVVLCSTVEHIGLAGRYDNPDVPDGDLIAMEKVGSILKHDGRCILTIPAGLDGVYSPWHRVYGSERLPKLLRGFDVVKSRFFVKRERNKWRETDEGTALSYQGNAFRYALGQFLLTLGK
jgi:SAM-dependent methyltransferase